jgi:hypothetical protein
MLKVLVTLRNGDVRRSAVLTIMRELMPVVSSGNVVSCAYLIQKVMSMLFQIKVQW